MLPPQAVPDIGAKTVPDCPDRVFFKCFPAYVYDFDQFFSDLIEPN
jgi:hypothetical protein